MIDIGFYAIKYFSLKITENNGKLQATIPEKMAKLAEKYRETGGIGKCLACSVSDALYQFLTDNRQAHHFLLARFLQGKVCT